MPDSLDKNPKYIKKSLLCADVLESKFDLLLVKRIRRYREGLVGNQVVGSVMD